MLRTHKSSCLNLWVHDERFSKLEVIVNPDMLPGVQPGDLLEIKRVDGKKGKPKLLLLIQSIDLELLSRQSQLQISVLQSIAVIFDLVARTNVTVKRIERDNYLASHIEISFRDQYVGRSDMWQVKNDLINTSVYTGKKILSLGFRGCVKDIYVSSTSQYSGVVTDSTKIVFRSETAKYFVFIQMSKEMWEFDEDGEMFFGKCVHGFLPELFSKWKSYGIIWIITD